MANRNLLLKNLAIFKKAYSKNPNPITAHKIKKLEKEIEKGKAGPGDPISKRTARELMLKKNKPKVFDPTGVLGMKMPKKKKKKDVDYWEAGANSGEGWDTTDDTDYSSVGYWESGGDQGEGWDTTISARRGGQIKKPKKKVKAKPRKVKAKTRQVAQKPKGVGIALRGYRMVV